MCLSSVPRGHPGCHIPFSCPVSVGSSWLGWLLRLPCFRWPWEFRRVLFRKFVKSPANGPAGCSRVVCPGSWHHGYMLPAWHIPGEGAPFSFTRSTLWKDVTVCSSSFGRGDTLRLCEGGVSGLVMRSHSAQVSLFSPLYLFIYSIFYLCRYGLMDIYCAD